MPVIRDPDGFLYYKEEVGGLVMGGFEPKAKPWNVEPIPDGFEFQLLPEDWDHFEILMKNAIHRTPCLETAEVKLLLNGPESFTLDGNFILGEAPELAGFFVCAGFNSAGIANAGGAGRLVAEWIVDGEAPLDLWDVDIRRFAPFHANRRHLADRTVESLGLHYAMRWPREELTTVRPLRRSPLYDRLAAKGAVFGSKMNWERANYFLPPGATRPPYTLGTPGWLPLRARRAARVPRGRRRLRPDVVLQVRAEGPRRAQRCCSGCARTKSTCPSDGWSTRRCSTRAAASRATSPSCGSAPTEFFIVTGSAQTTRDFAWIERAIGADEHAALVDVDQRLFGDLGDGPESRGAAQPDLAGRPVEGRHAVLDDEDDRRRLRAGTRGADELRRRSRLRALRFRRPVRDAVRRALRRRRANSACATPATTRSTRCASRRVAARGARSSRPTRRRGKRASATR